jgi:hypothetical protein
MRTSSPTTVVDSKAAHLFDIPTRQLVQTFVNPTPDAGDWFGTPVGVIGDSVLIGAPSDDADGTDAGIVYLFDVQTGQLLQSFHNPTPSADDKRGITPFVATMGDSVRIGNPGDASGGAVVGAAYLYSASTGDLIQTFVDTTPADGDTFRTAGAFLENGNVVAPDGTPVVLFSGVGGSGDNFTATVLDDQATASITTASTEASSSISRKSCTHLGRLPPWRAAYASARGSCNERFTSHA